MDFVGIDRHMDLLEEMAKVHPCGKPGMLNFNAGFECCEHS